MIKMILGIIVGFVVWTVVFVGGEFLIRAVAPNLVEPQNVTYFDSTGILLGYLTRSVIASILAGLTAVFIAKESSKTTLILGVILLIVGLFVQISAWNMLPVWYHLSFLILLIPMTIFGGKILRQ